MYSDYLTWNGDNKRLCLSDYKKEPFHVSFTTDSFTIIGECIINNQTNKVINWKSTNPAISIQTSFNRIYIYDCVNNSINGTANIYQSPVDNIIITIKNISTGSGKANIDLTFTNCFLINDYNTQVSTYSFGPTATNTNNSITIISYESNWCLL
jgi:hypothetical protein